MALFVLRNWVVLLVLSLAVFTAGCSVDDTEDAIHTVTIDRGVDGVLERYIDRAIDHAENKNARAVLLRVDTSGGEISSMKEIVGRIERSEVPVITYVSPPGAAAFSAGTFIAMSGHVVAMAPNTTIGAATPISWSGEDIKGALGRKVTNDVVAFARGVAELRGRNADWAEKSVREALSVTPTQALELDVVDYIAATEAELFALVAGREVNMLDGSIATLSLEGSQRVENEFNVYERVLGVISDPLLISLFFMVAIVGIGTELFFTPGAFVPGIAGAVALLLLLLGVGTLVPAEVAFAFVLLAIILFVLELVITTGGVLGAGSAIALALAIGIAVGQGSTDLSTVRVVIILLGIIAVSGLLIGAFLSYFAVRYWAPTARSKSKGMDSH